ncbi:MAG: hypothetical protein L3K02_04205 [Thermoplasmata archaeon]|nr:hypothetical protein [Thermoplasmata archaeon]
MRIGFVVVGVVLVLLGAVLAFVPLIQVASQTITEGTPYEANVTGVSVTGSVPASVSWSSNATISIEVGTCSTLQSNGMCSGSVSLLPIQNGTSGTFSFSVPTGGAFVVAIASLSAATASITVKLAQSTIGLILLIVGILLLIVGLVLKRKGSKMAASSMAAPMPSTPPASPPPPP